MSLKAGPGMIPLDGGMGSDTVSYNEVVIEQDDPDPNTGVTVDLGTLPLPRIPLRDGMDTLTEVENLIGSDYDDILSGDDAANILFGGGGDDVLAGNGGDDQIVGGDGRDTASYAGDAAGVDANLFDGTATDGSGDTDSLSEIENIIGSAHEDTLVGDDQDNVLEGGAGDDRIDGGEGADTVSYAHVQDDGSTTGVTVDLGQVDAQDTSTGWKGYTDQC